MEDVIVPAVEENEIGPEAEEERTDQGAKGGGTDPGARDAGKDQEAGADATSRQAEIKGTNRAAGETVDHARGPRATRESTSGPGPATRTVRREDRPAVAPARARTGARRRSGGTGHPATAVPMLTETGRVRMETMIIRMFTMYGVPTICRFFL